MAEKQSDIKPEKSDSNNSSKVVLEENELDPELVKLPRPPTRIRPIMAMAIIAICFVLIYRLWGDLTFSRQGKPEVVPSIAALNDDFLDHFVQIEVTPDRQQAIRMLPSRKTTGPVLMPILGHSKTLWLMVHPTPWNEDIRSDEVYQGRLRKISDMDFDDEIQGYLKNENRIARIIPFETIRTALKNNTKEITDLSGESFPVDDHTEVLFQEVSTKRIQVLASASANYTNENMWQLALANAGLFEGVQDLDQAAVHSSTDVWTFEVPARSGIEEIRQRLVDAKLFAAKAELIIQKRKGTWSNLFLDDREILLEKAQLGFTLQTISIATPLSAPDEAYLLITSETPETYWYMPILVVVLALFALLFAFGIMSHVRRYRS